MSVPDFENRLLESPLAATVSGEHEEHTITDAEFIPFKLTELSGRCKCDRCKIIRIKKRRAFRFPMNKCQTCGHLFLSILSSTHCDKCRGGGQ